MSPRIVAAIFGMAALAGCTTMTPQERRAADEAKCQTYGFKKNTDAFAECLQRIDLDRAAAMRAQDAEFNRFANRPMVIYRPIVVTPKPQ